MSVKVALVGNVDHGKSTVIGRLLADTGQTREEREARVRSYCESANRKFEYAFLLDALEEEQAQGITIDVTEVQWRHGGRDFLFVDTPGHREFLKKMVGGASSVDAAVLVLDAVEGISENFRRQIRVLELLGIRQRIVIINKMDLVDWSESTWRARESEILACLPGGKTQTMVIPVAAWEGANLLERSAKMPWYKGPTLGEALLSLESAPSLGEKPLRFFVQDIYRRGEKRIFVGRVEAGTLSAGSEIQFEPGGRRSRVRSIEGETGQAPLAHAESGDAVGLTLEDQLFLERGNLGFSPTHPPRENSRLKADLFWLHSEPLRPAQKLLIKNGTQNGVATVEAIEHAFDADSWEKQEGATSLVLFGRVLLRFEKPFYFDFFDDCEPLGRFVACADGRVLGGGRWVRETNLSPGKSDVSLAEREKRARHRSTVLWLTGLSGSGKTTLARNLERRLFDRGLNPTVLDGDNVRQTICSDLGFSISDRDENLRRVAEMARLMSDAGLFVITAFISPLHAQRARAREIVGTERFVEIFVDCSLEECERRDVKGLYRRARSGEIPEFTGISSAFEAPARPDVHLRSGELSVEQCLDRLIQLVDARTTTPASSGAGRN